jgi:hypothetical protein
LINTGINIEDYVLVKAGSGNRYLTVYKIEYARAALDLNYTNKEMGENINQQKVLLKNR